MKTLFLAVLAAVSIPSLQAQQPAPTPTPPPLPPGPLLQAAPDFAQWMVTTKQPPSAAASPAADQPTGKPPEKPPEKRLIVTKTGDIRKEEQVDESGQKSETWKFQGYTIMLRQGSSDPSVAMGGNAKAKSARDDFPGFEWISLKNYTGIQKVLGRDSIVFRGTSKIAPDLPAYPAIATVDLESRLPVSLVITGIETSIYQFAPNPPQEMLVPPPTAQQAVNDWQKHFQDLAKPTARPY